MPCLRTRQPQHVLPKIPPNTRKRSFDSITTAAHHEGAPLLKASKTVHKQDALVEAEAAPTPQSLASDKGRHLPEMDSDDEVMSLNGSSGDDFGADEDSSVDFGAAGESPARSHDAA